MGYCEDFDPNHGDPSLLKAEMERQVRVERIKEDLVFDVDGALVADLIEGEIRLYAGEATGADFEAHCLVIQAGQDLLREAEKDLQALREEIEALQDQARELSDEVRKLRRAVETPI